MKKVFIVQARMTSSRLPGKVLMSLAGRPMLAQQLNRLKQCRYANEIVIATTTNPDDDPVVDLARREDVRWFRGSEEDVLSRFVGAAREAHADMIVRITADCPLIDPEQSDLVISALTAARRNSDYASNCIKRTFPRGLDTEALYADSLYRTERMATTRAAREHVTYFIHTERPDLFERISITDEEDNSDLRWTVDTRADFEMITRIYQQLRLSDEMLSYREMLAAIRSRAQELVSLDTNRAIV